MARVLRSLCAWILLSRKRLTLSTGKASAFREIQVLGRTHVLRRPLLLRRAQDENRATPRRLRVMGAGRVLQDVGCNPFARNTYAQNKGTDVLIFTLGNAEMEMGLSFPKTKLDALDREHYEQPPGLCIQLTPGTLLVYSPLDDLFFCHEVAFPRNTTSGNATSCSPSAYRMAFVFRWLNECAERLYYLDPAYQGRHVPP